MPYRFTPATADAPETLTLSPHRSLAPRGFVWFIAITAALLAMPLLAQLGHKTLWVMLAFISANIAGIWYALVRNTADRSVTEVMTLSRDRLTLTHEGPRVPRQTWEANPHWVRLTLHPTAGPVPSYLTLSGNGREVELGAFLTPDERQTLHALLLKRLTDLRLPPSAS